MFAVLVIIVALIVGSVFYWLGRGVSLNRALRDWRVVNDAKERGASEDAFVNPRTGEIVEPGTKEYDKALKKGYVRFE